MVQGVVSQALQVSQESHAPTPSSHPKPAASGVDTPDDTVCSRDETQAPVTAKAVVPEPQFCSIGQGISRDAVLSWPSDRVSSPAQAVQEPPSLALAHAQACPTEPASQQQSFARSGLTGISGTIGASSDLCRTTQQRSRALQHDSVRCSCHRIVCWMSKAFRSIGMQVIPVDAKDAAQAKIVKL